MSHVKRRRFNRSPKNGDRIDCCICGGPIVEDPIGSGWTLGHNAAPLDSGHGRCCTACNGLEVIPARLKAMGYDI